MTPIWKDYEITVNASQAWFEVYHTSTAGTLLYNGKAVARPNESSVRIRLNDICANYLSSDLPNLNAGLSIQADLAVTFAVRYKTSEAGAWSTPVTIEFYNDWSYDEGFDADITAGLSLPISGEMDRRQPLFFTYGKTGSIVINNGMATSQAFASAGTFKVMQDLATSDKVLVTADGVVREYTLLPPCYQYALYYVNAFGGWDSLLIKGASQRSESYDRKTFDTVYDNNSREARGRHDYRNDITERYTFHSGWLDEEASARMYHLLGSDTVFLYDINEDTFTPVRITNNSYTQQTYASEGGKALDYEITVEVAREKMRR